MQMVYFWGSFEILGAPPIHIFLVFFWIFSRTIDEEDVSED